MFTLYFILSTMCFVFRPSSKSAKITPAEDADDDGEGSGESETGDAGNGTLFSSLNSTLMEAFSGLVTSGNESFVEDAELSGGEGLMAAGADLLANNGSSSSSSIAADSGGGGEGEAIWNNLTSALPVPLALVSNLSSPLLNGSFDLANGTAAAGGNGTEAENESGGGMNMCYLHTYDTNEKMMRGIGELVLVVWSLIYFLIAVREVTFLGPRLFLKTLALCPSRCLFLIACFLCQVAVPFRLLCLPKGEDQLALVIMLFTGPYFLFFCRSAMPFP